MRRVTFEKAIQRNSSSLAHRLYALQKL